MAGHPVAGKNAAERVEHRITELHAQLRITPAERQQWDQFVEVMRENARDMDQAFIQRAQQFPSMNALQNMQSYEQLAEAHARHLQKLVPAFENLYNAMPDQQKRLADQVFRANAEQHQQSAIQSHRGRNG
jgi:periplasmic protein CpxP/Spy